MRITKYDLQAGIDRLNVLAGTPATPYTKNADGTYTPNAFCYHLSGAYGGYQVQQMYKEGTGITAPITEGHVTKRECYDTLQAYTKGFESGYHLKLKTQMIENHKKTFTKT